MKIHILLASIIMMLGSYSSFSQDFRPFSKQLEQKCSKVSNKSRFFSFHHLRSRLYSGGKLDFINYDQDTLFILESYDIQGGSSRGRLWNRKEHVDYEYNYDSGFSFNNSKLFTDYTIKLTEKWDTASIREEERLYSNWIPVRFIYSSRIIFCNKLKFDCFKFKEFFNSKRD